MSCCGQFRSQASASPTPAQGAISVPRSRYGSTVFVYRGPTRLTVMGPATRTAYEFGSPGAMVTVDGRDSVAMAALPMLQRFS